MTKQSIQSVADQLAGALARVSEATEKKETAQEALEKTPAYKKAQEAEQLVEQAESEVETLKETLLVQMKDAEEKNVESGGYKIHTAEKVAVLVTDEDKLSKWLKKNKVFDQYVRMEPVLDKKALNKYVLDMNNDRQLPDEEKTGVAVTPTVYIVVKKA